LTGGATVQNILFGALAIGALVVAVSFAVLVGGLLRETRKLGRTAEDLSSFLKTTEQELASTTENLRHAVLDVDRLVTEITCTVSKVERAASGIERIVEGVQAAAAATKIVRSSTGGLVSVYEGVKQGIKSLRGLQETDKEGTENE